MAEFNFPIQALIKLPQSLSPLLKSLEITLRRKKIILISEIVIFYPTFPCGGNLDLKLKLKLFSKRRISICSATVILLAPKAENEHLNKIFFPVQNAWEQLCILKCLRIYNNKDKTLIMIFYPTFKN